MAYPDNLLARGERVVLHKHPHWKVLVLPILFFIVIIGGGSALAAWANSWQDSGWTSHLPWFIGIAVVGVVALIFLSLVPFLRWRSEHFVLTTGHVFFRSGILHRREHQIPLSRIQNMETVVTFWGRILGYGSLIVDSAADQPLEFLNVASLTKVQSTLNQLIADDRSDYGDPSDTGGQPPAPTRALPADDRGRRHRNDEDDRPVTDATDEQRTAGDPDVYPTQSVPPHGAPPQGYSGHGHQVQDDPAMEFPTNRIAPQGYPVSGPQGYPQQPGGAPGPDPRR